MQVRTKHHPRPTLILLVADSPYSMHCKSPNPVTSHLQRTYSLKNPASLYAPSRHGNHHFEYSPNRSGEL